MSPKETIWEKPIPRPTAQSNTAVTSAPDWLIKAISPFRGARCAKLALTPAPGDRKPRQLGPTMRSRCGWAARSISARSASPASRPPSPKPAVTTTAARAPRAPRSAISAGIVAGGVAITARSGVPGRAETLGKHGRPATSVSCGLTAQIGPAKPPAFKLRARTAPTDPGRLLAPIRAMAAGWNRASKLRVVIVVSGRSLSGTLARH